MPRSTTDNDIINSFRRGATASGGEITIQREQLARVLELVDELTEADGKGFDDLRTTASESGYYVAVTRGDLLEAVVALDRAAEAELEAAKAKAEADAKAKADAKLRAEAEARAKAEQEAKAKAKAAAEKKAKAAPKETTEPQET